MGYGGVRFSSWLSLLTNLVGLSITGCKRCQQLPRLSQLHSLECLSLINMKVLEYISDCGINEEVPTSSFFPSDDAEMLTSEMHDPYTRTTGA